MKVNDKAVPQYMRKRQFDCTKFHTPADRQWCTFLLEAAMGCEMCRKNNFQIPTESMNCTICSEIYLFNQC